MAKLGTPYAEALLRTLGDEQAIERAAEQLATVAKTVLEVPELQTAFGHPRIPGEEKKRLVEAIFGREFSETVLRFLYVLIDNGRLARLAEISAEFIELAQAELGQLEVDVQAAAPLTAAQRERLIEVIEQKSKCKVKLNEEVNGDLLGGLIVSYDGQRLDHSLRTSLENFRQKMAKN
ncbi:MAG: ATP synthase F1 subunit delta [Eubacteriales bacterium]|nr:ATP synthase F1 subunit delta [Eubacteriales bacterium]